MNSNFNNLPAPAKADVLTDIASMLETLALHSIDTASILSDNGIEASSWYIQNDEDLVAYTQKAKQSADKLRDIAWSLVYDSSVAKIKSAGLSYDEFVKEYLIPGASYSKESQDRFLKFYIMDRAIMNDRDKVAAFIKNMNYKDFLRTPYWRIIAEERKKFAGKCACCGSTEKLAVHHPTYVNHGYEHENIWELTVLCSNCHAKIHKK